MSSDAMRRTEPKTLPAGVRNAVLSEARILLAASNSIARRPLAALHVSPGWRRFGAMETPSYGNMVAMLLLLIALEAPAIHLLVAATMEDGALREALRAVFLGSSIYAALWLLGDLRLLRQTQGVLLGDDVLLIELGQRVRGAVRLENVIDARLLRSDDTTDPTSRSIVVTPQPRPNCRIRLRSAVTMRGFLGIPLRGESLDLYVDDPGGLVAALEEALTVAKRDAGDSPSPDRPRAQV